MVIAGPNGSGKTTLIESLRAKGVELGEYINADDISRALGDEGPSGQYERDREAQAQARKRRHEALEAGRSLSYETVMSHPSHIEFMREAKAKGYEVYLYFVGVSDPAISIGRVAHRVAKGGHDVPPDRTEGRYWKVMEQLADAVQVADRAMILDNSRPGTKPEIVAEFDKGIRIRLVEEVPGWVRKYLLNT